MNESQICSISNNYFFKAQTAFCQDWGRPLWAGFCIYRSLIKVFSCRKQWSPSEHVISWCWCETLSVIVSFLPSSLPSPYLCWPSPVAVAVQVLSCTLVHPSLAWAQGTTRVELSKNSCAVPVPEAELHIPGVDPLQIDCLIYFSKGILVSSENYGQEYANCKHFTCLFLLEDRFSHLVSSAISGCWL